jgi:hypothetical protein
MLHFSPSNRVRTIDNAAYMKARHYSMAKILPALLYQIQLKFLIFSIKIKAYFPLKGTESGTCQPSKRGPGEGALSIAEVPSFPKNTSLVTCPLKQDPLA